MILPLNYCSVIWKTKKCGEKNSDSVALESYRTFILKIVLICIRFS